LTTVNPFELIAYAIQIGRLRFHQARISEAFSMQFHILSFEGPDGYARAGGISSRVTGLVRALADAAYETHLWFVGDPGLPGHETRGLLQLHRWCQWISQYHRAGVYDGEEGKRADYVASLPPFLFQEVLLPYVQSGGHAVVLAEEWHTVDAVLHLDWLLRAARVRDQVTILWNANNTFSFHRIAWRRLAEAAVITTVSRYMKQLMQGWGVNPLVIPNGLSTEALILPERHAMAAFRMRLRHRTVLCKVARWDPDKQWLLAIDIVGALKQQGWRPLLVARGGVEAHGNEVLGAAGRAGLRVAERVFPQAGTQGFLKAMEDLEEIDVVSLRSPITLSARRVLFHGASAVLANSGHEPFGLVGLETMAVGGVACTGCSGEDYAVTGYNALVLETNNPREFTSLFSELHANPMRERALRRAGSATAKHFLWSQIIQRLLLPRLHFLAEGASIEAGDSSRRQPPARARPHLAKDVYMAPELVGWLTDRLEHLDTSPEDPARLPIALAKR
jgi:glycosyltransferase involved in cell wall biosynthesis